MSKVRSSPGPSYRGPAAAILAVLFFSFVLLIVHSGNKSPSPPARSPSSNAGASGGSSSSGSSASSGASGSAGSASAAGASDGSAVQNSSKAGAQLPNTGSSFPSWIGFIPLLIAATLIVALRQRAARADSIGLVERDPRPEVIELPLSLEEVEVAGAGERWFDPDFDSEDDGIEEVAFDAHPFYTGAKRP